MSRGEPLLWQVRDRALDITRGALMGVVNVTPDSFSDGGMHLDPETAIAHGLDLHHAGAAIIDVGGESTRPGADPVSEAEELRRVLPVISGLAGSGLTVSIDTSKVGVAREAVAAGAHVINDVTGGSSPGMADLVASTDVGVVLMHAGGSPKNMQDDPRYDDVVGEVCSYLASRARVLVDAGVDPGCVVIDPGIGFGKTVTHNLELLHELERLAGLGYPVMVGTSRKSFLGAIAGIEEASDRDSATAVTTALGFERGARIFRVHDVSSSRVALAVVGAIVAPQRWDEWLQV